MSAQADLLQLYQDWRQWTDAEREAIAAGDWRRVKFCQAAKAKLQPQILKQTEETQNEWLREGADRKLMEKQVRSVVNELIYLETRNGEFLAEQRQRAQEEFDALHRSGRNLGKLQKCYAPIVPTGWESFS